MVLFFIPTLCLISCLDFSFLYIVHGVVLHAFPFLVFILGGGWSTDRHDGMSTPFSIFLLFLSYFFALLALFMALYVFLFSTQILSGGAIARCRFVGKTACEHLW
jgi:hypothetical protein